LGRGWRGWVAAGILLVHAGLLAWGAWRHSPAHDEVAHLPAGISHWQLGRFDLYCGNPPLVRMIAALPVLGAEAETDWSSYSESPRVRSEFPVGRDFVAVNGPRAFWLFTLARWACIPLSMLGGWICLAWARDLYGPGAGLLALTLWCFCPNVIANGQMITPDVGAAALGAGAWYAFWRWLRRPDWPAAFGAGIALGLAELTKMTWVVLFALWPGVWIIWLASKRPAARARAWGSQGAQVACTLLLAVYVLNLGYGFEGSFTRLGEYRFFSDALGGPQGDGLNAGREGRNRFAGSWLAALSVPLPKNYLAGFDVNLRLGEQPQHAFLGGEWRMGGWWYYYLYAMAVKVPLGTWVLLGLALGLTIWHAGYRARRRDELLLWAPVLVLLVVFSAHTSLNKHFRYVLPVFPFVFIWIGKAARAVELRHGAPAALAGAALAWSVASSLAAWPHSVSYFNELVGGPARGWEHLASSNVDWGQDALYLRRWIDAHVEARPIAVAYRTIYDLRVLGIEPRRPPPGPSGRPPVAREAEATGPRAGWYALGVNDLRSPTGEYDYFLRFEPEARVAYSIYVYHITLDEANRVRRELGLPGPAPSDPPPPQVP